MSTKMAPTNIDPPTRPNQDANKSNITIFLDTLSFGTVKYPIEANNCQNAITNMPIATTVRPKIIPLRINS